MSRSHRPFNMHHNFWTRSEYKTPSEKRLRNHDLMITPMWIPAHNELHARMKPPNKPAPHLIMGALSILEELPADTPHPEALLELAGYFDNQDSRVATGIGKHLVRQAMLLGEGEYHDTRHTRG